MSSDRTLLSSYLQQFTLKCLRIYTLLKIESHPTMFCSPRTLPALGQAKASSVCANMLLCLDHSQNRGYI